MCFTGIEVDVAWRGDASVEDGVAPFAAIQRVCTVITTNQVIAAAPIQDVIADPAFHDVGVGAAQESVHARTTLEAVCTGAPFEHIISVITTDKVIATVAKDMVVAAPAKDKVTGPCSMDFVGVVVANIGCRRQVFRAGSIPRIETPVPIVIVTGQNIMFAKIQGYPGSV